MTLKEAIKHLEESLNNPEHKWSCEECKAEHKQLLAWLKELKEFKEAQKGDLISREALKEKLKPCEADVCEFSCEGCHFRVVTAEDIDNAPTVAVNCKDCDGYEAGYSAGLKDAERPQGEWKHIGGDEWVCSECGHVITTEGSWETPLSTGAYHCENCGADMRGGAE